MIAKRIMPQTLKIIVKTVVTMANVGVVEMQFSKFKPKRRYPSEFISSSDAALYFINAHAKIARDKNSSMNCQTRRNVNDSFAELTIKRCKIKIRVETMPTTFKIETVVKSRQMGTKISTQRKRHTALALLMDLVSLAFSGSGFGLTFSSDDRTF